MIEATSLEGVLRVAPDEVDGGVWMIGNVWFIVDDLLARYAGRRVRLTIEPVTEESP